MSGVVHFCIEGVRPTRPQHECVLVLQNLATPPGGNIVKRTTQYMLAGWFVLHPDYWKDTSGSVLPEICAPPRS